MAVEIIIAHAEGQEHLAELLAEPLRKVGYGVSHRGTVLVGRSVTGACAAALAVGAPVILCATVDALGTGWAHWVVNAAKRYDNVRVFPVRMEEKAYIEAILPDAAIAEYWRDPSLAIDQLTKTVSAHYPLRRVQDAINVSEVEATSEYRDRTLLLSRSVSDLDEIRLQSILDAPLALDLTKGIASLYVENAMSYLHRLEYLGWVMRGHPCFGLFLAIGRQERFGNEVAACTLQMANHNAVTRGGDNVAVKLASGNLLMLYEQSIEWLTGGTILRRERSIASGGHDDTEIPAVILRECLVNALVHRDYARNDLREQPTRVDVFSNRVEITSFGSLPDGITTERLNSPDSSLRPFRRNPVIAQLFQCVGLAELNASGVERIQAIAHSAHLKYPLFQADGNTVCVTIFRPSAKMAVFVSSVMRELVGERKAIAELLRADSLLSQFFEPFLFEELQAAESSEATYLSAVDRCDIFVSVLGHRYGSASGEGLSATEEEYNRAVSIQKPLLVFVKGTEDSKRDPRIQSLVRRAKERVVVRRYAAIPELTSALYDSLVNLLKERNLLGSAPAVTSFADSGICDHASMEDISESAVKQFCDRASRMRSWDQRPGREALERLGVLHGDKLTYASVMLFGKTPQRYLPSAETRCAHFHGTEVAKPISSLQVYAGTLVEQADCAVDFVMGKLNRGVFESVEKTKRQEAYEVPRRAVREIIVNAIAHRDYSSTSSTQVHVFADRIEVWNPGRLPEGLSIDDLAGPHPSVPRNRLVANALFLVGYIESGGSGTVDVIRSCRDAGLPDPKFSQRGSHFVATIWRMSSSVSDVDAVTPNRTRPRRRT